MEKFKVILKEKRECINGKLPWYSLHWGRDTKILENIKIVNSRRSKRNVFALENLKKYEQSDIMMTSIKEKFTDLFDIKYLLALLNSKLYYVWLYNKGKRKGELLELFYQPLAEIPIKKIPTEAQKPFIDLVDQILEITSAPVYNPKNPPVKQRELEKQIDELVYKLYDLTDEEVRIVEESSKK